jgi:chemotaxis protein methyltransferase WspC
VPQAGAAKVPDPGTAAALADARRAADAGRLPEAAAICHQVLAQRPLSAEAFCLMGLIQTSRGDPPEAESCFQKALYLDPRHEEALVHMMLLARQRGDVKSAANYRRRIDQLGYREVRK